MLRIDQLKLPVGHTEEQLKKKLLRTLRIRKEELIQYHIRKRSLDARKKPELFYSYSVDLTVLNEKHVLKRMKGKVRQVSETVYRTPEHGNVKLPHRPVIDRK